MKITLYLILALGCLVSYSQPNAVQLTNIVGSDPVSSSPGNFVVFNNNTFFTAGNTTVGVELWKTDGTSGNTTLLKDIYLGNSSSGCSNFQLFKGKLFFTATDGINGFQLWQSDGTSEGTTMVTKNLRSNSRMMIVSGTYLYILQRGEGNGYELWKSDGTTNGTTLVTDNIPGFGGVANLTSALGLVFFSAGVEGNGAVVWRSDGTESGTFQIAGDLDGSGSAPGGTTHPTQFIEYQGNLYFVARSNYHFPGGLSVGIVKTDGTVEGTQPMKAIHSGNHELIEYGGVVVHNDKMFFSFFDIDYNRYFIWQSGGTETSTEIIYDRSFASYYAPSNIFPINNNLYFTSGNNAGGTSLIRLDLLSLARTEIKELSGQTSQPFIFFSENASVIVGGKPGQMFIKHAPGNFSSKLWTSNGTPEGTLSIADMSVWTNVAYNSGRLFFNGANTGTYDYEPWSTDGTISGTGLIRQIQEGNSGMIRSYSERVKVNNQVLFDATSPEAGTELWTTDGTPDNTKILADKFPGSESFFPSNFIENKGKTLFIGKATLSQYEIFSSDGSSQSIMPVTNFSSVGARPFSLLKLKDDHFLVWVQKNDLTSSLFDLKIPGTATELVNLGKNSYGSPWGLRDGAVLKGVYYFLIDGEGTQLWKSDGTPNGTAKVKDLPNESFEEICATASHIYISTRQYMGTRKLYRSDGSEQGTVVIKTFDGIVSEQLNLFAFNDNLLLTGRDAQFGRELWIAEGTSGNVKIVKDINPGADFGVMSPEFCVHDNVVFFVGNDSHGTELWRTDGTSQGTVMVKDIHAGPGSSRPNNLVSTGGKLYFAAYTPEHGMEIWTSTGEEQSTQLLVDVNAGPAYSNPRKFVDLNGRLVFFAISASSGEQVYSYADEVTSVEESTGTTLSVYPNPSRDVFYVSGKIDEEYSLTVYSSAGTILYSQPGITNDTVVDLQSHAPGIYVFRFVSNRNSFTVKTIKR